MPAYVHASTLGARRRVATSGWARSSFWTIHAAIHLSEPPEGETDRPSTFRTLLQRTRSPRTRPQSSREARFSGYRDPLRHHRAIVGPAARTPWYIRIRAAIILILVVAAMGVAIAGFTLILLASGRFLLEILAG